jgi:hypothetical protein
MQYRSHKAKYDKLCAEYKALEKAAAFGAKRKTQKALGAANNYYEAHRAELTLHAAAVRYLQELQRGHDHWPNPSTWEAKLEGEKKSLYEQYYIVV